MGGRLFRFRIRRYKAGFYAECHRCCAGFVGAHVGRIPREVIAEIGDHHRLIVSRALGCELKVSQLGLEVEPCVRGVDRLAGKAMLLMPVGVAG